MSRSLLSLIVGGSIFLSGCGFHSTPLAVGAVGGAAAGAGTGAIIGSVIANGDVAASALLGGAIGVPVGLAIGMLYDYNSEPSVRERKLAEIKHNEEELFARQREIDALRDRIRNDGPSANPSEELREHQYNGSTLGNYYR
jgi:phage tail tape-measure protein